MRPGGDVVDHARSEPHLLAVDAHQRAVQVGAYHQDAGRRRQLEQLEAHRRDALRGHLHRQLLRRVPRGADVEHVPPGQDARAAAVAQLHLGVGAVDAQLESGRLSGHLDGAVDALQRGPDRDLLADRRLHGRLGRLESGQLEDRGGLARRQRERDRCLPARAQVLAVDVHGRARRIALDPQQGEGWPQPLQCRGHLAAILVGHLVAEHLRIPAECFVVLAQLLEAAGHVADRVAVPHQAVGGEELGERLLDASLRMERHAAVEAEIRLVGDRVRPRGCADQHRRGEGPPQAHQRSALMPGSCWRGGRRLAACSRVSRTTISWPSPAATTGWVTPW